MKYSLRFNKKLRKINNKKKENINFFLTFNMFKNTC